MKTLTDQLREQHKIEHKLEPIEIEITKFLNKKEIFEKIKESLKYQFEVKDVITNKYTINLIPKDKNTYKLFVGIDENYTISDIYSLSGYIKLNKRKDKLKFKISTIKINTFLTEDIIKVIEILVGN